MKTLYNSCFTKIERQVGARVIKKYRIVKVSRPSSKPLYAIERTGLFGVRRYFSTSNYWWSVDNIDYCYMALDDAVWYLDVLLNGYPEVPQEKER